MSRDLKEYFDKLELDGIHLTDPQRWWYEAKYKIQKDDMFREFPSKPDEAFSASQDGYWYASVMKEMYDAGRVTNVAYDKAIPVHTAWDLGQADAMSIFFFQINRSDDINIIDFWQKTNTPLNHIGIILKEKGYNYGIHLWPHDAAARDRAGITFQQQARDIGITGLVLEPHSLIHGINLVKTTLSKCWFDAVKCKEGLKHLENYQKKWSPSLGGWTSEPVHNEASHCFVGETVVLTNYGMCRIMDLPKTGEVWTLLGWKKYYQPRITRKNARIVEVKFQDGTNVKCTGDHLFLTEIGWKFAKDLKKDSKIQSSLTNLFNILMASFTDSIRNRTIIKEVMDICTDLSGKLDLEQFLVNVISIIKMETMPIIDWKILNAFLQVIIYQKNGIYEDKKDLNLKYHNMQDREQLNGILLQKEENGIESILSEQRHMKNGQDLINRVCGVKKNFMALKEMEEQEIKNSVAQIVKPLTIETVEEMKESQDVWCLSVPEIEHFSLENGAIVHNCADAFRYLCAGVKRVTSASGSLENDYAALRNYFR